MEYEPIVKNWKIVYDQTYGDPVKEGNEALRRLLGLFVKEERAISLKKFYCRLCGEAADLDESYPINIITDFIVSIERIKGVEIPIENLISKNVFYIEKEPQKCQTSHIYAVKTADDNVYYIATADINCIMVNALAKTIDLFC